MTVLIASRSLLVLGLVLSSLSTAQARTGQSVLIITGDDHGRDLGVYGNTAVKTPHLDGLAGRGVRFSHAFTPASSCSPSRAVIFSGLFGHASGQYGLANTPHNFQVLPTVEPVSAILKRHGYFTGSFGKLHLKPEPLYAFDELAKTDDPPAVRIDGRDGQSIARRVAGFLAKAKGKPFFLHVGFFDAHRTGQGFENDKTYAGVTLPRHRLEDVIVPSFLPDLPEVRRDLADYYQSVSRLDQNVGMVLDALRAAGRVSDTLVVYASDNGMPFPGAKTNLYDPGVRLPFIVASPFQKKRGLVSPAMVSYVDFLPTVLEWTGAPGPAYPLPGRSFLRILEEEHPEGWEEVYFSHSFHGVMQYYPMRGMRTRRYKYIANLEPSLRFRPGGDLTGSPTSAAITRRKLETIGPRPLAQYRQRPPEELYDLDADPNEVRNLAGERRHARVLADLRGKVQSFRSATRDVWLRRIDRVSSPAELPRRDQGKIPRSP